MTHISHYPRIPISHTLPCTHFLYYPIPTPCLSNIISQYSFKPPQHTILVYSHTLSSLSLSLSILLLHTFYYPIPTYLPTSYLVPHTYSLTHLSLYPISFTNYPVCILLSQKQLDYHHILSVSKLHSLSLPLSIQHIPTHLIGYSHYPSF